MINTLVQKRFTLQYKLLYLDAYGLQAPATAGSAGYDICAYGDYNLEPGVATPISTGIAVRIPDGYVGLVFARSGMRFKLSVDVFGTGVIDSDYRGEIRVLLRADAQPVAIKHGMRIAQLVIVPLLFVQQLEQVEEFDATGRGDGGFGSTGIYGEILAMAREGLNDD